MRKNKVESGRNMVAPLGADVLEALVRISIEEKCAALNTKAPKRLMVGVFSDVVRETKDEARREMPTVLQDLCIFGPGNQVAIV